MRVTTEQEKQLEREHIASEEFERKRYVRIGELAAGTGKPFKELAVIYGKARVQGRLMGEDVNQILEAGIPLIQELAKQFGISEGGSLRKRSPRCTRREIKHMTIKKSKQLQPANMHPDDLPIQRRGWRGCFMHIEFHPDTNRPSVMDHDPERAGKTLLWAALFVFIALAIWLIASGRGINPTVTPYLAMVLGAVLAGLGITATKSVFKARANGDGHATTPDASPARVVQK